MPSSLRTRASIETLNQPHDDDNETAEGVVNEVNDSFKTSWRLDLRSCFAWFSFAYLEW